MAAALQPNFTNQLAKLLATATTASDGNRGQAQRAWHIPIGWVGNPFAIADFAPPFSREAINAAYVQLFRDDDKAGTVADMLGLKLQAEYLASQERAFRLRHASPIRCGMHAAARRRGHGRTTTGLFDRLKQHVHGIIAKGAAT